MYKILNENQICNIAINDMKYPPCEITLSQIVTIRINEHIIDTRIDILYLRKTRALSTKKLINDARKG